MTIDTTILFISGLLVAGASGLVGSLLILRRMTLLSDALSHVALPGIALGIIFHFTPLLGGIAFLFLGVLLIWGIEGRTRLALESITGVLFVTALAAGAALMPETELLETFFGSVETITLSSAIIQAVVALGIIWVTLAFLRPLVLTSIAPELSVAAKISERKMQLLLLTLIALTIGIGISFVGILLMSGLAIIPAATARNFSKNFKWFTGLSVGFAALSLLLGLIAHFVWEMNPGSATVFVSAFFFVVSLFVRR
jgi:ABC-type Mn2+/Zn2+ transport system permease subunit